MAETNVQLENGYTKIANELLEAVYRYDLTKNELKVLLCVFRHTYGYNQKEHVMSLSFIANDTGLPKSKISTALKGLNVKNLLFIIPATGRVPQIIGVQKHYEEWLRVTEMGTVTNSGTVTNLGTEGYQNGNSNGSQNGNQGNKNINKNKGKKDSGADKPPPPPTQNAVCHKHGEYKHVLLTDEQYNKLLSDYGEKLLSEYIRKVDEYCQQHGKSYSDWNLTVRNWMRRDGVSKISNGAADEKDGESKKWE